MNHMTMLRMATNRHKEELANAARWRLAYQATKRNERTSNRNRSRNFRMALGNLRISIDIAPRSHETAQVGAR